MVPHAHRNAHHNVIYGAPLTDCSRLPPRAAFAVLGTQTHHCGYRWPWTPGFDHQPDFHDFHHEKFNTNYGLTGWCDALRE